MRRPLFAWSLVLAALGAACATATAPKAPPPTAAAPTSEPAPAVTEPPPALALFDAALEARSARREERAWRCWTGEGCADEDDVDLRARERAAAEEVVRLGWRGDARAELLLRAAARVLLEEVTREALEDERRAIAAGVLWDDEAPFSWADLPALLAEAAPKERPRLLASASSLVEERRARAARAAQARKEAAEGVGLDEEALLALRAGLSAEALRALARRVLDESDAALASLLPEGPADVPALVRASAAELDVASAASGAVVEGVRAGGVAARAAPLPGCFLVEPPNDVRYAGDERSHPAAARFAKGCVAAGRWHPAGEPVDALWVQAVGIAFRDSAWLSPRLASEPTAPARRRALHLLEARRAAVEVLALLDAGVGDERVLDALATRWASPRKAPQPGASALLTLSPDGASVDALVAHVLARKIERALVAQVGERWARGPSEPVARVIVELAARYRREGPRAFLDDKR